MLHCTKEEVYRPVEAIVVYAQEVFRAAALPADIGRAERDVIAFRPRRIVLPELTSEALEAHDGAALIALPLVGDEREVERRAGEWLRSLQQAPLEPAQRQQALELFVRFLAHRLGTIDLERLLGEGAQVVEHTATGQALIAKGIEQGIVRTIRRVLERRFGSVAPDTLARLEAVHDVARLEQLAEQAAVAGKIDDFARALAASEADPPASA